MPAPTLLSLLAPPAIGGFIGYLTNYVAIRMLFRPLRPWRLLGIALPMTPGVIPKKRRELARNIGQMVGGHLLTSADVSKALADEGFQRELQILITSRLDDLFQKDLGPVATLVPQRFRGYLEVGIKIFRWRLAKHLRTFLESDSFAESVAQVLADPLAKLLARTPADLLGDAGRQRLDAGLEQLGRRFLASSRLEELVRGELKRRLDAAADADRALQDLLPPELIRLLHDQLAAEVPHLLQGFARRLQEPLIRDRIARAAAGAVNNFIASLGPMAALVGNFINPELIERKIRSYLEEKGDDLAGWLFDATVQHRVADLLRERADGFLAMPVASLVQRLGPEKVERAREELASQLLALLRHPDTAGLLGRLLREGVAQQAGQPLGESLAAILGEDGLAQGKTRAAQEIVALLRSAGARKMLDEMVGQVLEQKILGQPIGSLAAFLPREVQEGIGDFLREQVGQILVREVPGLVDALNIQEIVARKVDSLDLLRLEGLLLSIMQEQFKYINIFGAILGFLIGGVNLLFMLSF